LDREELDVNYEKLLIIIEEVENERGFKLIIKLSTKLNGWAVIQFLESAVELAASESCEYSCLRAHDSFYI